MRSTSIAEGADDVLSEKSDDEEVVVDVPDEGMTVDE
jgi:hypothetical protein